MALDWSLYIQSFGSGALIDASAALFRLLDGRIAGISGIAGSLLASRTKATANNAAFIPGFSVRSVVLQFPGGARSRLARGRGLFRRFSG